MLGPKLTGQAASRPCDGQPADHPLDKLTSWEDSAMLKHADAVAALDNSHDPELVSILDKWQTKHRARVQAAREKYWPQTGKDAGKAAKHPRNRWTGRDLAADAKLADQVEGSDGVLGVYDRMHSMFCWSTHGTGAVGMLSKRDYAGHHMTHLSFGAQLGLLIARLALVHFGLYDAEAQAANNAAKAEAEQAYQARVREHEDGRRER